MQAESSLVDVSMSGDGWTLPPFAIHEGDRQSLVEDCCTLINRFEDMAVVLHWRSGPPGDAVRIEAVNDSRIHVEWWHDDLNRSSVPRSSNLPDWLRSIENPELALRVLVVKRQGMKVEHDAGA